MRTTSTLLASLMAGAALLAGCERADDRADNQTRDAVVAKGERAADSARNDVREAGRDVRDAADSAADKTRDAGITTAINARLVGDPALSALRIDVDTTGGRVKLSGSAPDAAAKDRATSLARGVDGVTAVDNQLQVQPRN